MGIFSSKKKTYVSSVAYTLGEDDDDRTSFLQYTVLNAVLQERPVGESISQGYLRGQGVSLRNAFRFAQVHYTGGMPEGGGSFLEAPDAAVIQATLESLHPNESILVMNTVVGTADFEWWAEQYLTQEYGYDRELGEFMQPPTGVTFDAAVAYDLENDGRIRILLMNPGIGGLITTLDYRPVSYVKMKNFVHVAYRKVATFAGEGSTTTRAALPAEVTHSSIVVSIVDRVAESQETTTTTTTTVVGATATVVVTVSTVVTSRPQYFLYELGKGTYPLMDAWEQNDLFVSPYYPAIPIRRNNVDMTDDIRKNTALYKSSKKLLNRLGIKIDRLGEQLNENDSIDDIDYAFVVFGVGLNATGAESKIYLYKFFEHLRNITSADTTKASFDSWKASIPASTTKTAPGVNKLSIFVPGAERKHNYDITLQWQYIDTQLKSGVIHVGARPGDVDIGMSGSRVEIDLKVDVVLDGSVLVAKRQIDEDTYEELQIGGLTYDNYIYNGKSVSITAYDAFQGVGTEDEEEGFIIPLNHSIVRDMRLKDITQLSYSCCSMVLNCYKVVKQKWYQSSWFRIVMVIIAIIIVFVSWGAGTPVAISLLGTTIVIAGTLMVLLAATLYVLAMMLIMNIILKVATKAFGPTWGAVIAAIAMIVIGQYVSVGAVGANAGQAATTLTAQQIIQGSISVVSQAYGAYTNGQLADIAEDMAKMQETYSGRMEEIKKLTEEMLGTNTDLIDIQGFTEATAINFEQPNAFLLRTLITGSDIVEITSGQIEAFAELGLALPTTG